MKHLLFCSCLLVSLLSFSQEPDSSGYDLNVVVKADEYPDEVPFAVIENVPIYEGCDESLSNIELKDCMNHKVAMLINSKFRTKIAVKNGLTGRIKIFVFFKITKDGVAEFVSARAPIVELEEEAERIVKLMPKFTRPGIQRGKPVTVPYMLPIAFEVEESPKKRK